jgi:hypothetical protein
VQWSEIRQHYPGQWLLVEAVDAHTEGDQRILDDVAVLQPFEDVLAAMDCYSKAHRKSPSRELYVVHTKREVLEITETYLLSAWIVE